MAEHGVGYGSINHPVDRCKCCSYHGVIGNECPSCGNEDEANIEKNSPYNRLSCRRYVKVE